MLCCIALSHYFHFIIWEAIHQKMQLQRILHSQSLQSIHWLIHNFLQLPNYLLGPRHKMLTTLHQFFPQKMCKKMRTGSTRPMLHIPSTEPLWIIHFTHVYLLMLSGALSKATSVRTEDNTIHLNRTHFWRGWLGWKGKIQILPLYIQARLCHKSRKFQQHRMEHWKIQVSIKGIQFV